MHFYLARILWQLATAGLWMPNKCGSLHQPANHITISQKRYSQAGARFLWTPSSVEMEHRDIKYQATDMFIMLGNKCQTLCNQPGACALVGFSMGKIMSKEVKPLTHCVHNPHLQANIIGGKKKNKKKHDSQILTGEKTTVLFDKLCKLGIDMYSCRSCNKQCWFKVPDKFKAAQSATRKCLVYS